MIVVSPSIVILQLLPERGRKRAFAWLFSLNRKLQLIPVRGRKHIIRNVNIKLLHNYNLSPQGDGNIDSETIDDSKHKLQLIPARGRKLLCFDILCF